MRQQRRTKAGRTRLWIVCAVLAASLWRGPVPWIHSHETLEAQGLPEAALAWHVHHLHPHESGHEVFGWHVHLTYPWDVRTSRPLPPIPTRPSRAPSTTCRTSFHPLRRQSTLTVMPPHGSRMSPLHTGWAMAAGKSSARALRGDIFQRFHPSRVSLCALICVARC